MDDSINPRTRTIAALSEMFLEIALNSQNLACLESNAIDLGHGCIAEALGLALEALDAKLLANKPKGLHVHDIRSRTLATEIGDVGFSMRRYRDHFGCDVYLLADTLDIAYGSRVSPGAHEFLTHAATHTSYAKAAALLARHGSQVKATTVMRCMREAGSLCAEEDETSALSLYRDGVIPDAESEVSELCMEADGTYFRAQGLPKGAPTHLEVKAVCAYVGKEMKGNKVRRRGVVHHALVGSPGELWSEGVAGAIGKKYDLIKLRHVHLGGDGEKWCRDAERYLPRAKVDFHLDPFHINRAIMAALPDKRLAWSVIDVTKEGDKQEAVSLLRAAKEMGAARERQAEAAISYLEGNIDYIETPGPSLGTMETDNQHLYGSRMDAFPCAWSLKGASDMARMISRRESNTPIPKMTRERSVGERRRKKRERKELNFYEGQGLSASKVLESDGSGYLPPHQVSTKRMASGKAYALHKGMANMDRGI